MTSLPMFSPTDVVVTVEQAKNLIIKGKNGVNDAYATIELLKEKYATGTEKSLNPKWLTECSFNLPTGGIQSAIVVAVAVYHKRHGKLGLELDEFLGQVSIPLSSLDSKDDKKRSRWYTLLGKRKDSKKKDRGQIEVSFQFQYHDRKGIVPNKKHSPAPLKALTSGLKSKLRRRSVDEDSGVGISDGDHYQMQSLAKGSSSENISFPSATDSENSPLKRNILPTSSTTSSGGLHSARGSTRLLQTNNLSSMKATSVEVLHRPDIKIDSSSIQRSNSGSGGGRKLVKNFIKQHTRNRSMPDSQLVNMTGQLRKDGMSKSALCINGSHLYVPGPHDPRNSNMTTSCKTDLRSSSLENVSTGNFNSSQAHLRSPQNKNTSNSSRRHSVADIEKLKQQGITLSTLYKPKNYYRLDVKELRKVSTIHEDTNSSYQNMTHAQLIQLLNKQQEKLNQKNEHIRELEDYIDSLLLKVMTFTPQILDGSLSLCKTPTESKHSWI